MPRPDRYKAVMTYISPAELAEIVPDLRAMADVETVPEVRAALLRLAHRYVAPGSPLNAARFVEPVSC